MKNKVLANFLDLAHYQKKSSLTLNMDANALVVENFADNSPLGKKERDSSLFG